jgi:hypothetical protein
MNQHARASYLLAVVLLLVPTLPLSAQELKLRATLTHELWGDRDSHLAVSVACSGDGTMLASAGRSTVKLWDVARAKVEVTDGPFVETKETLGGILLLEARDLNHTIALMSKHSAVGVGNIFEIRPANEAMNRLVAEWTAAVAKEAHKGA